MKKLIVFVICVALLVLGIQRFLPELEEKIPKLSQVQDWELGGSYNIDTADWFAEEVPVLTGSQEYTRLSVGLVNNLKIRAAGCKLEIQQSQEPEFYYTFENMKRVQAYQLEDSIILNVIRDTQLEEGENQSVLTLYVPADSSFEEVYVELGAGSLHMDGVQSQSVELTVEAGKLVVTSLEADTLTASVGAGMMELQQISVTDGDLSVGAGNMTVEGCMEGNLEAECAMGNLQIYLIGTEQDFNYEVQCVAGNIQIEEEKYSGINEKRYIDNSAEKTMKLDCAVGNMKLVFHEK